MVFSRYDVREVLREGKWRREIGRPVWKVLGRDSVEVLNNRPLD